MTPASIETYTAAWNETDDDRRLELLAESWVPAGEFLNAQLDGPIVGIEALSRYIRDTNSVFPGHTTVLAAGIVHHNGCALVPWRFVGPAGVVTLEGLNFVELTPEGLLKRVVQFFPATLPSEA